MAPEHAPGSPPCIAVGGDVWVDFAGLKDKDKSHSPEGTNKQRRTDENRWFFLPGGALLVEEFVRAAVDECVRGHRFGLPDMLKEHIHFSSDLLKSEELIACAARLTPKELPRSLLSLERFAEDPKKPDEKNRIRVDRRLGFLGAKEPELKVLSPSIPAGGDAASFVVLDDTRDEFRNKRGQWPTEIDGEARPVVVHKLHSPLPRGGNNNLLWARLSSAAHVKNHIVIVSIDDLRRPDTPISRGLSWERTALDVVWQLLNAAQFDLLRDCRHLIVRFGINGALYWRSQGGGSYKASLIYDPAGIEGSAEQSREGLMVGYGSAFVAAVLKKLFEGGEDPVKEDSVKDGVKAGLVAGRRLLEYGFEDTNGLRYPCKKLFGETPDSREKEYFACRPVPVLSGTTEADPGYWRLLDGLVVEIKDFDEAVASVVKDRGDDGPEALRDAPSAVFEKFRTRDRREIEQFRALYSLMREYLMTPKVRRPLNVAVFGPPGAGKSFGVTQVANALKASLTAEKAARDWAGLYAPRPTDYLTFNLSQYKDADELAAVFHRVRDIVLNGRIPLVFLDEFDAALEGVSLGWLRYFLSPMQDAEFLDRGLPHPIGQAIFVFGGGTCSSYEEFARPFTRPGTQEYREFKNAKGPDFLSRLRATLDIPGLDLDQPFDAYGPVELLPCEAAIQLRRASILRVQLREKASHLLDARGNLSVSNYVIRAFLKLREFRHGNRSLEALLDMSHLLDAKEFFPSSLPAPEHTNLHASARELSQLLAERDHFSPQESKDIDDAINADPFMAALQGQDVYRMSVEDIPRILRLAGCEFRKAHPPRNDSPVRDIDIAAVLWRCPEREHDRWVAQKRRDGWVCGPEVKGQLRHPWLVRWGSLPRDAQAVYTDPIFKISKYLKEGGYVVTRSGQAD